MPVYLVADPQKGGRPDIDGFLDAYRQFFGTSEQPNLVARTTVEVASLGSPGIFVEVDATAARSLER